MPRSHAWRVLSTTRVAIGRANNEPCCRCHGRLGPIRYDQPGSRRLGPTADHLDPIAHGGQEIVPLDQLGVAHNTCNSRHGSAIGNTRQGIGAGSRGGNPANYRKRRRPTTPTPTRFLPNDNDNGAPVSLAKKGVNPTGSLGIAGGSRVLVGDVAAEGPEYHEDGFVLPRIMPALPPGASFDLADEAIEWIEANVPGPPLLPHQRFETRITAATVPTRGAPKGMALAFPTVVNRKARQQGKTFWARRYLACRLLWAEEWLGQPQRLMNTHPDGAQAVRLMEPFARAMGYGGGLKSGLTSQTFMAEWYPGGAEDEHAAAWFARAMTTHALTGNQGITLVYVDELQDAKDKQISESLSGSLSGSRVIQPQRVFTGTGEKPHSELLRKLRSRIGRPRMGWIEWSAPPGSDPADPRSWRWASPDWSEAREEYLSDELETALGSERPHDALRDFAANYVLSDEALTVVGLIEEGEWVSAGVEGLLVPPDRAVVGLSLDHVDGSWPVVMAAVLPAGGVGVRVVAVCASQEEAVAAAAAAAGRSCLLLVPRHALRGQVQVPGVREVQHATEEDAASARTLAPVSLRAGLLRHDAADVDLTEAVLAVPAKRVARVWDAGTLALVCAWWASKPRQRSAAA